LSLSRACEFLTLQSRGTGEMPANPPRTGVVCPSCHQPVGVAENRLLSKIMLWCPACNHRWIAKDPSTNRTD